MSLIQSVCSLGECIDLYGGGTPSKDKPEYWNGDIPWASVKDLKTNRIECTQDSITALGLTNSSSKMVKAGSIVIATRMAVGRVAISEIDVAINQDLKAIVCSENVDVNYLFYFLASQEARFSRLASGATVKGIKINHILDMKIPLPPLAEQQKIAAILDAADSLRKKDQQLIDHYTTLSQSLFLEMFGDPVTNSMGWNVKKLGDISKKITDGEHQNPPVADKGMNLIMAKDVLGDRVDFSKPRYVNDEDYNKYIKKCNPENGDVLLVSRGATVGRCTVVNTNIPFCLMGSVILLKPDINILGLYISYIFKHHNFSKRLVNVSSASAQQAIYINHLKKLIIPSPPIELQNLFADRIAIIEKQKQQAKASLEKSNALFNSLLQRAFNGELTGNKAA